MPGNALLIFLMWAFVAEVIGTMAGFGAATVLTPVASFFMDIKTAVAVVACFHLFGNASRLWFFWRDVQWPTVIRFGLPGIVLSVAGAQASVWLPAQTIRLVLGGFLIVYAVTEAVGLWTVRVPATTTTLIVGGIVSGFIAGLIGTGGAIRSVCLLAFGLPQGAYLGTSALIALAVDATRLPVYVRQQFIPATMLPIVLGLTVVAFSGSWTGQRLVRMLAPSRFKQVVVVVLGLMGVKLFVDGW